MKKHFFELLVLSLVLNVNIHGQLTNGLKAYYAFSGNADDQSGQNHHGVFIGNPSLTTDRFGMSDCAYLFPGNNMNYISLKYHTDFDIAPKGSFSISLWYQGGSAKIADYEELFRKGDSSYNTNFGYSLALYDLNQEVFGNVWSTKTSFQYPDTNWYHLVAIYDNKKWYLYKDTVLRDSELSGNFITNQANNNISIGKNFLGKIDDVRFYNRALNTNEISQIFKLASSCLISETEDIESQSLINIFPNPSSAKFTLTLNNSGDVKHISVYNLLGVEVLKYKFSGNDTTFDLSNFPNGFYLVKVQGKGMSEKRLIEKL